MDEKKKSIFGGVNRKQLSNALRKKPTSLPVKSSAEKLASINSNFPKARKTATLPRNTQVAKQQLKSKATIPLKQKTQQISFSSQKINFGSSNTSQNPVTNQKKAIIKPQLQQKNSQKINQPVRQINSKIEKFTKKNKYQDQKLYDIKDRKVQGCGEKYQDQKLYDIKDHKVQGCGEKYQDQKLYDIKDHKVQGCGKKYQDHRLK